MSSDSLTTPLLPLRPRIICACGTSDGVHELLVARLTEESQTVGKRFFVIDAQLLGMTPHMFFSVLQGDSVDYFDQRSDPERFGALNDAILLIDHAEELLTLKRFRRTRHIWTFLESLVSYWNVTMFLLWQTQALIPQELDAEKRIDLEPIGIDECKLFADYRGYDISNVAAARFLETCNGFLEYGEAFNQQYRSIDTWDDRSCCIIRDRLARNCRDICRHRWDRALLLARGYSSLKAVMVAIARKGDCRLTEIAREIGGSVQATKEYLNELLAIGMVTQTTRTYRLKDPIFEMWLRSIDADSGRPVISDRSPVRSTSREESFLEID